MPERRDDDASGCCWATRSRSPRTGSSAARPRPAGPAAGRRPRLRGRAGPGRPGCSSTARSSTGARSVSSSAVTSRSTRRWSARAAARSGRAMTVTARGGNVLSSWPAAGVERLRRDASPRSRRRSGRWRYAGCSSASPIDEYADEHVPATSWSRHLGADQESGALDVGDVVPVGPTVQFLLRDADYRADDLAQCSPLQARVELTGWRGALVFSCNGRGRAAPRRPTTTSGRSRRALGIDGVAGLLRRRRVRPGRRPQPPARLHRDRRGLRRIALGARAFAAMRGGDLRGRAHPTRWSRQARPAGGWLDQKVLLTRGGARHGSGPGTS